MGVLVPLLLFVAQESSIYKNTTTDVNGNRVNGPVTSETRTSTGLDTTERTESINGRMVPRERIEERVVREDSSGRVVERTIRHYDQTGNPGPAEKTVIEEQKHPDGSTVRSTTYRADLNGAMQVAERSLEEMRTNGSSEISARQVERPSINGGLEVVEKRTLEKIISGSDYQANATTYRKGENGFYPALQLVTNHSEAAGQAIDRTAEYEVGSSGKLELHSQIVARTEKRPDGTQLIETDHYGASVPGTVNSAESGLKLKERDVVDRRRDGSAVVEITSVRRPTVSDPGILGPAKVISETVCRGKCQ